MSGWERLRPKTVVLAIALLCCMVELILQAADYGLIGSARWRSLAYQNGAFWAGLLHNWRPNYPAQPWAMFVTYSVLHGGFGHLVGNMIALLTLAPVVLERMSQRSFLGLWIFSAIGGAAAFGLLSQSPQPMVGASGALFGLAGAWKAADWRAARKARKPLWPILLWVLGIAVLNLVLWVIQGGLLAWETHLGGFVAGWAWVMLWPDRTAPTGARAEAGG